MVNYYHLLSKNYQLHMLILVGSSPNYLGLTGSFLCGKIGDVKRFISKFLNTYDFYTKTRHKNLVFLLLFKYNSAIINNVKGTGLFYERVLDISKILNLNVLLEQLT